MKLVWWVLILAILIQAVPFGHSHTNPAVTKEPGWDSSDTASLFHRACYDCHSNQTTWPWYSNLAPVSWLVQRDVNEGRRHLNFTQWASLSAMPKTLLRRSDRATCRLGSISRCIRTHG